MDFFHSLCCQSKSFFSEQKVKFYFLNMSKRIYLILFNSSGGFALETVNKSICSTLLIHTAKKISILVNKIIFNVLFIAFDLSLIKNNETKIVQQLTCCNSLKELADFIEEADKGLSKPLVEGDYDGLLEIMGYLMKVKERQIETDNLFEPLKDIIELVKVYDMDFPEETYVLLQVYSV